MINFFFCFIFSCPLSPVVSKSSSGAMEWSPVYSTPSMKNFLKVKIFHWYHLHCCLRIFPEKASCFSLFWFYYIYYNFRELLRMVGQSTEHSVQTTYPMLSLTVKMLRLKDHLFYSLVKELRFSSLAIIINNANSR